MQLNKWIARVVFAALLVVALPGCSSEKGDDAAGLTKEAASQVDKAGPVVSAVAKKAPEYVNLAAASALIPAVNARETGAILVPDSDALRTFVKESGKEEDLDFQAFLVRLHLVRTQMKTPSLEGVTRLETEAGIALNVESKDGVSYIDGVRVATTTQTDGVVLIFLNGVIHPPQ